MTSLNASRTRPGMLYLLAHFIALSIIVVLIGCSAFKKVNREITTPESFRELTEDNLKLKRSSSPFLKAHLKNGNIYVLQNWAMDQTRQHVIGTGELLNTSRDTLQQGSFRVDIDSVAIFETNVIKTSGPATALTVFTGITVAITAYCIANPKACFGSCPTFYISDGDSLQPDAEGFSSSIAPSLEATDIDALFHASASHGDVELEMRNEALETHVVRYADLLVVPRMKGNRVFVDRDGNFWESSFILPPVTVKGHEGDCFKPLLNADTDERFSRTDSSYLGKKEFIELQFNNISPGKYGLVIGCRQTLLSTYLLYQTFAYMGNHVGYWFAEIERKNLKHSSNSIINLLGGIEVLTQNPMGEWQVAGEINEYGPLAIDFHLIPLGHLNGNSAKLRLKMTQGNWRIDYVALAKLLHRVQPVRLKPFQVLKDGDIDQQARSVLCDSLRQLVTFPGDCYTLRYHIPNAGIDYEIFLQTRGYYLEWIRKEWIEEENPYLLAELLLHPEASLKRLAAEFKQVEEEMERCFWRSRYAKHE